LLEAFIYFILSYLNTWRTVGVNRILTCNNIAVFLFVEMGADTRSNQGMKLFNQSNTFIQRLV